jgi:hypothetical protein
MGFTAFTQEDLSVAATAVGFTAATYGKAIGALVYVDTAQIRFTLSGTSPTASSGVVADPGSIICLSNADQVQRFKAIRTGSTSATLHAEFGNGMDLFGVYTPAQSVIPFTTASVGYDVQTTVTRAANQTPYTALDVVGGAIDLGVLGPSAKAVRITSAQLELDITAIPSGMTTFTLHLYSVTPPSAVADNGAFDLPAGDRASYLGAFSLGTPADLGSTLYCEVTDVNKQVLLAGTHLFGYLVTTGAFTPAANSEVYKITMHTVAV